MSSATTRSAPLCLVLSLALGLWVSCGSDSPETDDPDTGNRQDMGDFGDSQDTGADSDTTSDAGNEPDYGMCEPGYVLADGLCVDLDECLGEGSGHDCHANAECANTPGAYTCACRPGFTGSGTECTAGLTEGNAPRLGNYRVEPNTPSRVYFDSSEPITGTGADGIIITGKTVSGVTINAGQLTGHYFSVTPDFTFWQQSRTIRSEGGNDFEDGDGNAVFDFTLRHIVNLMPEPGSDTFRFVSTSGDNNNDGSTALLAWRTLQKAATEAVPGTTVWVKAGSYGNERVTMPRSGTPTKPIKFIGYKDTPDDISGMYYSYGDGAFDPSQMPYFRGANRVAGTFLTLTGRDNIIIRNLQAESYQHVVFSSDSDNLVLERLLGNKLGDPEEYGGIGIHLRGINNSWLDSTIMNATAVNFRMMGDHNLIRGCKSYCDESLETGSKASTDYYFANHGNFNVTKDSLIHRVGALQHHGHGYTMKEPNNPVTYNLVEDSTVINIKQAIDLKRDTCAYNVVRNVLVTHDPRFPDALDGGIKLHNDVHHNTFEYVTVENIADGINFTGTAHNNTFVGCVFDNISALMTFESTANESAISGHIFVNSVFNDVGNLMSSNKTFNSSNTFTNCVFTGVSGQNAGAGGFDAVQTYSNYFDGFAAPSGAGNISVDPMLDADFRPTAQTPAAVTEGGVLHGATAYDADNAERTEPVSIGAFELD